MKTVLITGANRGMGLGFVRHYLRGGCRVVAAVRNPDKAEALQELAAEYDEQLLLTSLDVGDEGSVNALANFLEEQKLRLDLLINNAGVSIGETFGQWTAGGFEANLKINTVGPALVTQAATRFMNEGSSVVNITSGMGSLELNINPANELDAYAVSKAALNLLTRRLAEKLRPEGVTVIALNPGWVQTDMGGAEAPVTIDEAVAQMTKVIDNLTPEMSGGFYAENGGELPW